MTMMTACSVCAKVDDLDTGAMVEGTNYTLSVSGVPTADHTTSIMNDMVVSVGLSTAGGMSHSYASFYNAAMPTYTSGALTMLEWGWDAPSAAVVKRGTFSQTEMCVMPGDGNPFSESVELSITSSVLTLLPAAISAGLGDDAACGNLGAAVTS